MGDLLADLYETVERRKAEHEEGSYTAYLFDAGIDKILKKVGEEAAETIIAAKNLSACSGGARLAPTGGGGADTGMREDMVGEIGDLLYHLTVMMNALGVTSGEVEGLLRQRMEKTGNLKKAKETTKNT